MNITYEMFLNYLKRRERDLATLRESLRQNRVAEFARIGHQVSGNAATFGFFDLESIARKIEEIGERELQTKGSVLVREFANWLKSAREQLGPSPQIAQF